MLIVAVITGQPNRLKQFPLHPFMANEDTVTLWERGSVTWMLFFPYGVALFSLRRCIRMLLHLQCRV